ncbi:HNH endonuclease [Haloprofundus sp. MHR1]|uniref:HNH endonuclease n=1 Tax=Haloprofundus sp. MHR1 TaxID=2572921 RepID=UPI0010BE4B5A|nr:HNH endonuclease [Haloprofundus sp. MHR1]QCJ47766.1 HNH endonuclease [Haloprofundus sp. MHR1]
MKLSELELDVGEQLAPSTLKERFDRGMTGRGIEICYDEENQRYLRVFSDEDGPYSDDVRPGQFLYIGDGKSGDQKLTHGNKALVNSIERPLPIFFFHREASVSEWEYQGLVEVVNYEYGPLNPNERSVFQFLLQRESEGVEVVDEVESVADLPQPDRTEVTRCRVIRNTTRVRRLKELYDFSCQVCGQQRRRSPDEPYAEGHHLQPLGGHHNGPDAAENLLVLCPNHHADFDYGVIEVDPETLRMSHAYDSAVDGRSLTVSASHKLDTSFLEYHNRWIANF